jgi:hypothetical protein
MTQVYTTGCYARLTPDFAGKVADADLRAARAVEGYHNYAEQNLRVWADGVTLPAGWTQEDDYVASAGVGKDDYDVVARHLTRPVNGTAVPELIDGKPVLVLERRDGTELARYPLARNADPKRLADLVRDRLLGKWRWQFLARQLRSDGRPGDRVCIKVRVVPLEVEEDQDGQIVNIGGERKDFTANESVTRFQTRDCIAVDIWNLSQAAVYVSVLDLGPSGSIRPLFPTKDAPKMTEYAPARIEPGRRWQRTRTSQFG